MTVHTCPSCGGTNVSGPAIEKGSSVAKFRCKKCDHRWSTPVEPAKISPDNGDGPPADSSQDRTVTCPGCQHQFEIHGG